MAYIYSGKNWSIKKIYIDIINYLNIFNKQDVETYAVIICEKTENISFEKQFRENAVSYISSNITNIIIEEEKIKKDKLKKIYLNKLNNANLSLILKILLLIISGSIITTNLIYSVLYEINIKELILATVIYYCYSYIIRYIYKPLGTRRVVASYIFPIYFLSYIIVSLSTLVTRVIKKVQVS